MYISKLQIKNVRNLNDVALNDLSAVNVFTGDNGAGKTSVLEALHIASIGRSFRHQQIKPLLNYDSHFLRVYLECLDDKGISHKVGIERNHKNDYKIRINGQKAPNLASLSLLLPFIVIDSSSFNLLDGSSSERRKFLDWGVFHVEHQFYENWRNYSQILKQRNTLLRQKPNSYALLKAWDGQFADFSVAIEAARIRHLRSFATKFNTVLNSLDSDIQHNLSLIYKNGWGQKFIITDKSEVFASLAKDKVLEVLKNNFDKDKKYQRTIDGAHRADIQIIQNKQLVKDTLSRGQKKTVVAALKLTQASLLAEQSSVKPIVLLDDMPSELDKNHLTSFFNYLNRCEYQQFITAVDVQSFDGITLENPHMFHVEHGQIKPIKS